VASLSACAPQYPGACEAELRRRLADLLLGEELARKVFGGSSQGENMTSHGSHLHDRDG